MTISHDLLTAAGRRLPFLQQIDDQFEQRFLQQATLLKLQPKTQVCLQGSECAQLALMLEGSVRVYKLSESGKEITLYRIGSGEGCILTASCILSSRPFPAFAVCETAVEAISIPANSVRQWLSDSVVWRDFIFGLVASRLSSIINVVEEVAFRRMDKRIASYLCQQAAQGNDKLLVTHREIASELGTSREVVSRILKDFEHDSLLRVTRGEIELQDIAALKRRLQET